MACCLFFCDDSSDVSVRNNNSIYGSDHLLGQRQRHMNTFALSMADAYKSQPTCCLACLCPCYYAYVTRTTILTKNNEWPNNYKIFQGYGFCCGCEPCPSSPEMSLCLESICCTGLSISASRLYMMDTYGIRPDPMDYRIIRFENCIVAIDMLLQCLVNCFKIRELRHLEHVFNEITRWIFACTAGCMVAQVLNEVGVRDNDTIHSTAFTPVPSAPVAHAQPVPSHGKYGTGGSTVKHDSAMRTHNSIY